MASLRLSGSISLSLNRCNGLRNLTSPLPNRLSLNTARKLRLNFSAAYPGRAFCVSTTEASSPPPPAEESSETPESPDESKPAPVINRPPYIEPPMHRIDKPVSLIAGASRGLGLEFTRQILSKYPDSPVVATCRNPNAAEKLLALRDEYPSQLTILKLDVTEESDSKAVAKEISDKYGRLDLYINTVGILHVPEMLKPERKIDEVDHDKVMYAFKVNAVGPTLVAKHMLQLLKWGKGEGTGRSGAVMAHLSAKVGSIYDNRLGGWYSYRASKAGLNQLTRTIGVECLRLKEPVLVVLLHPGTVDTDLSKPFSKNVDPEHLFTPQIAVEKLLNVIDNLKPEDSAKFFAYDGQELPW